MNLILFHLNYRKGFYFLLVLIHILHFNIRRDQNITSSLISDPDNINWLIPIDIQTVDNHLRITITKKLNMLTQLKVKDKIMIYQHKYNKNLLLRIIREEKTIDNWILTIPQRHFNSKDKKSNLNNHPTKYINHNYSLQELGLEDGKYMGPNSQNQSKNGDPLKENTHYDTPILIVDDDKEMLTNFKLTLLNEGYTNVNIFPDSRSLLQYMLKSKNSSYYKFAIIDIRMPDINGLQLYQILRILNPTMKIIFMTSVDLVPELTSLFIDIKTKDIIKKPIDSRDLVDIVYSTLNNIN
jgi:CheY-like chemotaxis protein